MRARRSISVSMPPRLVAQRARRTLSSQRPAARPVRELEREDAAGSARHLAQRELVVGMAGEAGVVHRVHRRMLREPPCELGCGRHLAREAHVQRPQTAQEQPRGVGSEHAADRAARQHESLAQLRSRAS